MAGVVNGRGRRIRINGRMYDGEWKDDKRHGFGLNRWPSNNSYEGYFYLDKKHAYGSYTFPDGHIYEGEYHHDKQ